MNNRSNQPLYVNDQAQLHVNDQEPPLFLRYESVKPFLPEYIFEPLNFVTWEAYLEFETKKRLDALFPSTFLFSDLQDNSKVIKFIIEIAEASQSKISTDNDDKMMNLIAIVLLLIKASSEGQRIENLPLRDYQIMLNRSISAGEVKVFLSDNAIKIQQLNNILNEKIKNIETKIVQFQQANTLFSNTNNFKKNWVQKTLSHWRNLCNKMYDKPKSSFERICLLHIMLPIKSSLDSLRASTPANPQANYNYSEWKEVDKMITSIEKKMSPVKGTNPPQSKP